MRKIFVRLHKGDLLKEEILKLCINKNISSGVIISSVGSLDKAFIRNAGGNEVKEFNEPLEIISLNGTVSNERIHLHISVSDKNYNVYGGHLMDGSIINTTCELGILIFDDLEFKKTFDEATSYNELEIIKKDK